MEAGPVFSQDGMQTERPVFVVGASRSGTALLQSILNNADVHLAGETHHFDDLRVKVDPGGEGPLDDAQRRRCEDYYLALTHRPYGHAGDPEKGWLARAELDAAARAIGPGADAYFEAYCRLETQREGKARWGEKTPRHVFRLTELLTRYPQAQAVCMVRDARAVVASYRDWRNQGGFDLEADPGHAEALEEEARRTSRSYHILIASLLWRSSVAAAVEARRRFGDARVYVQRYEDLVREPEAATRRLAAWLGLPYTPELLDVALHNSSVSRYAAHRGVATDPLERWRTTLSAREIAIIESCCAATMRAAGYERTTRRPPLLPWLAAWLSLPFAGVRAALANRDRIGNLPAYVWRRLGLAARRSSAR